MYRLYFKCTLPSAGAYKNKDTRMNRKIHIYINTHTHTYTLTKPGHKIYWQHLAALIQERYLENRSAVIAINLFDLREYLPE